ncbi:hypothetical protein HY478_03845 [Candidatus Uhrbacteria bacterium]|nr:hypothetical protein [Candidatus Uhrbacteria bacterium]
MTVNQLEKEIGKINERNKRVEADKAWEISVTRRALLAVFTYLAIGIYLSAIKIPDAWLNAIVPAIGFMLSTLTLPFFKKIWLKNFYKNERQRARKIISSL